VTALNDQNDYIKDEILKRDIFTDKYLPLLFYRIVSDSLHSCLPSKLKLQFAYHEHSRYKKINYDILTNGNLAETRENAIKLILEEIKVAEVRQAKIIAKA
jgi:hypothetical protein